MGKYTLPEMPYAYDALEPHIDARTMEIHHTKHHQKYTDGMNGALEKLSPELQSKDIVDILSSINDRYCYSTSIISALMWYACSYEWPAVIY